jgi:small conductance mechanosensitive channel
VEQVVVKLQEWITLYGLKVVAAVVILILGRIAAIAIRSLVKRVLKKSRVDETLVAFATSVSYVAAMAFVIIAALGQLGVQTASFVAVLGAAGLAVGLALQGSLANFAAGVLMIIFKPFKVGDFIEAGGTSGIVEEIGIFTTELKTPDNKKVIVPNAKATGDNITNFTANEKRRVDIVAGVSYGDDIDRVRGILAKILEEDERILKDPAPTIGVLELADSSVNFAVRPWVKTADYWDVFFATQEKIKKRFDAEGITIPFPQQDVHLFKTS